MKKLVIAIVAAPVVLVLVVMLVVGGLSTGIIGGGAPSADARADIPANYLVLYQQAADTCPGLPWPALAGIGKIETNHGRLVAPGVTEGANFAGAAGPMQMGIGVGYNHAQWYVDKVLAVASSYAASAGLPAGAPISSVVDAALQFAYNQLGKPYSWGGTGEGGFYDCSGLTLRAYQAGGLPLPRTAAQQWNAGAHILDPGAVQAGDLVFYASDLSNPATIHHVGIYIGAGNMINAPHAGAVIRVQPAFRGDYLGAVRPTATGP